MLVSMFICNQPKATELQNFVNGIIPIQIQLPSSITKGSDVTYTFQRNHCTQKYELYVNGVKDAEYQLIYFDKEKITISDYWSTFDFFYKDGRLDSIEQHIKPNDKFNIKEQNVSFSL